jgi:hypothetical protein
MLRLTSGYNVSQLSEKWSWPRPRNASVWQLAKSLLLAVDFSLNLTAIPGHKLAPVSRIPIVWNFDLYKTANFLRIGNPGGMLMIHLVNSVHHELKSSKLCAWLTYTCFYGYRRLWCRIVSYILTDVQGEHVSSVFTVETEQVGVDFRGIAYIR